MTIEDILQAIDSSPLTNEDILQLRAGLVGKEIRNALGDTKTVKISAQLHIDFEAEVIADYDHSDILTHIAIELDGLSEDWLIDNIDVFKLSNLQIVDVNEKENGQTQSS